MQLYYITDRLQFPGHGSSQRELLLRKISETAQAGIDYIQLRENDLSARELELLAREAVVRIRDAGSGTRLLINSRTDIAIAVDADGVHLRSKDVSPQDVRKVWQGKPIIAVSCHTEQEVVAADMGGADFVVFGPVFEKRDLAAAGPDRLTSVCNHKVPVFALGGVTVDNARECVAERAAGVAGIRLFQENEVAEVVRRLR